jgi:hypothetical protein
MFGYIRTWRFDSGAQMPPLLSSYLGMCASFPILLDIGIIIHMNTWCMHVDPADI